VGACGVCGVFFGGTETIVVKCIVYTTSPVSEHKVYLLLMFRIVVIILHCISYRGLTR
jgi:hypothetical protein